MGLANVGTEDHKGGELQHEAFALLKQAPINFIGNIEARIFQQMRRMLLLPTASGNCILKLYEGVAMVLMNKIKGIFTKSVKNKLAAAMVLSDVKRA